MPVDRDRLLNVKEVMGRYGIARNTVYELVRTGVLPAVRLGRVIRFSLTALELFEERGGVGTVPQ